MALCLVSAVLVLQVDANSPRFARRSLLTFGCAAAACPRDAALAESGAAVLATGTITVQKGATVTGASSAALYVTVRPLTAEGGALQAGTKVVPLATARFAAPITFPFKYTITSDDLTAEYKEVAKSTYDLLDLVVSARFDDDGVAATRGPDDLVGRGLLKKGGSRQSVEWQSDGVELQGRGLTGRLLTGGSR